ncbi:hypothetical protein Tco_1188814, partial [Tanacetum coccineum]
VWSDASQRFDQTTSQRFGQMPHGGLPKPLLGDKMAEENVPAPTRTDEQLVLVKELDILQNTNFFSAFTASADVPTIYIQQFWNTLTMDTKSGVYSFQLNELWFTLDVDLLRSALGITPKDYAQTFVAPPASDLVIDFVKNLGNPEEHQFVSNMYVNSLYQPWRTILSMINQCLTGKTFGSDRPRHPVLQILWGVVLGTNIDYVELIWKEFIQSI